MEKVVNILETYGNNQTLTDGFLAVLESGKRIEISWTTWNMDDTKSDVGTGIVFNGLYLFDREMIRMVGALRGILQ